MGGEGGMMGGEMWTGGYGGMMGGGGGESTPFSSISCSGENRWYTVILDHQ